MGADATCVRCARAGPRRGVSWPEGYVCRRCFQRATRIHGTCPGCGDQRLLPGLDAGGASICVSCAGITQDLICTRCGQEDERHRRGLCARCCLRQDLTALLDDGTGVVRPELVELLEAVCGQQHPRSALIWLRSPDVRHLLTGFATGTLPLTHAILDAHPAPRTATHLRDLLMRYGGLEPRDRVIASFQAWLAEALRQYSPATAGSLRTFATWHHLRRMRHLAAKGQLRSGTAHTAKQEITAAAQLLTHLESIGVAPAHARQGHLDVWLTCGPSTRYHARSFVTWAARAGHCHRCRSRAAAAAHHRSSPRTNESAC